MNWWMLCQSRSDISINLNPSLSISTATISPARNAQPKQRYYIKDNVGGCFVGSSLKKFFKLYIYPYYYYYYYFCPDLCRWVCLRFLFGSLYLSLLLSLCLRLFDVFVGGFLPLLLEPNLFVWCFEPNYICLNFQVVETQLISQNMDSDQSWPGWRD